MAVSYDSSLVYCVEADVEREAVYDFDASSEPTEDDVYEYAQDAAAAIESKTEYAGNLITPTASLLEPVRVQRILQKANAVGAAMMARFDFYKKSGSERDRRIWEALAMTYEALMGAGSSGGGTICGCSEGGDGMVGTVVASEANTGVLANEITEGDITLKGLTNRDNVEPVFTTEDVD